MDASGVVTIMHADVEASTELTTRLGDNAARDVLRETKRLVRVSAEAAGGRQIDETGDAMMLTFGSTRAGIAAAIDVQDALAQRERDHPDASLRVRLGLNVGEVLERDGHPFGAAVNAGARVMALGKGGEVLVSELVRRLAGTVPGVSYRDRGRHRFKGFDEPWRVYEVVWDRLPLPARKQPRRRPSWLVLAAGAAAVLVAAGIGAWLLAGRSGGSAPPGLPRLDPNTVGLIDPRTHRLVRQIAVGTDPRALAAVGGSVWVANYRDQTVTRLDERTGRTKTIPVEGHPTELAPADDGVWVNLLERRVAWIDQQYDRVTRRLPLAADHIAAAGDGLWLAVDGTTLRRVDADGRRIAPDVHPDLGVGPLLASRRTVWTLGRGKVLPIDARSGIVGSPIAVGGFGQAFVRDGDLIWVLVRLPSGAMGATKVDTRRESVIASGRVGASLTSIGAAREGVWLGNAYDASVVELDPSSLEIRETIPIKATPTALAAGARGIWVAAG